LQYSKAREVTYLQPMIERVKILISISRQLSMISKDFGPILISPTAMPWKKQQLSLITLIRKQKNLNLMLTIIFQSTLD